jgi:hypothetical protein
MRSFVWSSFASLVASLGLLGAVTGRTDHSGAHSLVERTIARRVLSTRKRAHNRVTQEVDLTDESKSGSGKGGTASKGISKSTGDTVLGPKSSTSRSKGEGGSKSLKGGSKSLKGGSKSLKSGSKSLKGGSKGVGKGGSKGGDSGCSETIFYYKSNAFKRAFQGEGLLATNGQVAIFNEEGRKIGTYSESTIVVGQRNCNSNGVYTFDFNSGVPSSQTFTTQTCCGVDSPSIMGGTGLFQCTTGFVEELKSGSSPHRTYRRVVVCDSANGQCLV